jgi:hypothetical protein
MAKDRFYVKVDVYDGALDDATGRVVLENIAESLPGSYGMPDEFAALPTNGRVAGSERFTREAFLGLRELERCVSAEYMGGRTVFAVLPSAGSDVDATWQELSSKWNAIDADGGAPVLAKKVPYTGLVGVTRKDDAMVGVVGAEDEAGLLDSLSQLR